MTPPTPRQHALDLIASYATHKATLEAASAPILAQIASLQAALATATCEAKARLEDLEDQAKALALQHGPEIFGPDKSSLIECGLILAVRPSESVKVDDEDASLRALQRDAESPSSPLATRLAAQACLRVKRELNKSYILENHQHAPEWFAQYGISVEERQSASLKPAPKPRAAKSKTKVTSTEAT